MKPGDVVADRFQVEVLAGSGGMGDVYRARDLGSGAAVALKILHGDEVHEHARFAREAEVLAGLHHPAVVAYIARGVTAAGEAYLAMEWLDGESLADRLKRGRLSLAETMALASRLAEALAVAHRAGVVHRDLKPGNVMLAGGDLERAKLVDFGIARVVDRTKLTETGATLGTIGYMAPEQARGGRDIDARADVFAFGAVLFRCLTGRTLFEGNDPVAILVKQATRDAPRLSEVLDGVPPPVDDFLARLLAKAPAERLGDAVVVLAELRKLGAWPAAPPLPVRSQAAPGAPVPAPPAAPSAPIGPGARPAGSLTGGASTVRSGAARSSAGRTAAIAAVLVVIVGGAAGALLLLGPWSWCSRKVLRPATPSAAAPARSSPSTPRAPPPSSTPTSAWPRRGESPAPSPSPPPARPRPASR
jgi:serine/threonine protein kinase